MKTFYPLKSSKERWLSQEVIINCQAKQFLGQGADVCTNELFLFTSVMIKE